MINSTELIQRVCPKLVLVCNEDTSILACQCKLQLPLNFAKHELLLHYKYKIKPSSLQTRTISGVIINHYLSHIVLAIYFFYSLSFAQY